MTTSITAALFAGFILGLQHAVDPDHLVAVSTIVSEHKSVAKSSIMGTLWGLGHTLSLMVIGLVVLLLKVSIPPNVGTFMEMAVALMLVVLGATVVRRAVRDKGMQVHVHTHSHGGDATHTHLHVHAKESHEHRHYLFKIGRKPFLVGIVHGVAGSAALTLLVLSTVPSVALGLAYIGIFGLGSVGGMLVMSAMISLPFVATSRRFSRANLGIRLVAGIFSVFFGLVLGWRLLGA